MILEITLDKIYRVLNNNGVLYCSFKLGTFEGERNGRYFNDMTIEKITPFLTKFNILTNYITTDVRTGRDNELWLNIICRKEN